MFNKNYNKRYFVTDREIKFIKVNENWLRQAENKNCFS